jgi:Gti1/Pac2 family transcription factor
MREPFLFYEEKVQTTAEEKQAKADRRARKASSSDSQAASAALLPLRRQDRPSKPDGLTKQTYSCEFLPLIFIPPALSL